MKSFQNKSRGYRSLQSKKCVHGRCSKRYLHEETDNKENCNSLTVNSLANSAKEKQNVVIDPHSSMMKEIIKINEEYFQSKIQVNFNGRSQELKLKIPSKTGFTVYKKDYSKKAQVKDPIKNRYTHKFQPNKLNIDFDGHTTYRQDFLGKPHQGERHKRKYANSVDPDAPSFLESHYQHNYLNWGANSFMPSMKPQHNTACTNFPFQAVSVYTTQFKGKSPKVERFMPNSSCISFNSSKHSLISNRISSPMLYMTTSKQFHDLKNTKKENILRPNTHTLKVREGGLKGKTQYQSEFIKLDTDKPRENENRKPLEELQSMILSI